MTNSQASSRPTAAPPETRVVDHAAAVLRLLADRTRLAILSMLDGTQMSVGAIAESLGRPVPAVSQHLAKLRAAGMVTVQRQGTTSLYGQPDEHLAALVLNALQLSEHALYEMPPHHRPQ